MVRDRETQWTNTPISEWMLLYVAAKKLQRQRQFAYMQNTYANHAESTDKYASSR